MTTPNIAPNRRAHYVRENSRSETIYQCVWYDCETRGVTDAEGITRHELVFGWAAYSRRYKDGRWSKAKWLRFTRGYDLWKWITSLTKNKRSLYVWAHNQTFDWCASSASYSLDRLNWTLRKAIVDAPPFVMEYLRKGRRIVLADTLNIWRMSLAEMGKLTGLVKLEMPLVWTGKPSDDSYCRRDVEIIMRAVQEWADFLRNEDLGKFCLTVASQAMQTFRHRDLSDRILIESDPQSLRIARAAYHGGRVECFYIGPLRGPLYMLDINSLYPFCMREFTYPLRLIGTFTQPPIIDVVDMLQRFRVCAHVTLRTTEPIVPVKENGKLIFPTGTFDAYVSTPELEYLLKHQQVLNVQSIAVYEEGRPFLHFVENLYQRKVKASIDGNKVEAGHYKLLLNSFSGKWGQNGIKWTTIGRTRKRDISFYRSIDIDTNRVTNYRRFNGLVQRRDTFPESRESHPAIAAHITSYGRMVLWALMRKIPPKHNFYCDTDSILVTPEGFEHIKDAVSDVALGGLKIVGKFTDGVIYGCKDYVLGGIRTCKGIRDQAVESQPGSYRQQKWVGFRGALRNGWLDAPRCMDVNKVLRRVYTKGVVQSDGFVLPFHRE